mmetsp:Transcript_57096/g.90960  ORF Transcript_57096/g.90960 Transcript_57096/m.90960 type:complete len:221 (+) Transcript_57096:1597-2259(+)
MLLSVCSVLVALWLIPVHVECGCEDYADITSCQLNAPCKWRTRQNICFGRKNSSIKWFEMHKQQRCEFSDVNVTAPIEVKLSVSNDNSSNSIGNCSEISTQFASNSASYFISYGSFDGCAFNTNSINSSTVTQAYIYCDANSAWEACTAFHQHINLSFYPSHSLLRYHCQCGQLRYTNVPKVIDFGGLSHHGYYTYNGSIDEIDRDYAVCSQVFTLYLHL